MATTDTQQTAQFAAEASVSAAEAKQYLIEVQQGYQDISATTQEAINAATAAEAAKAAAETSEQNSSVSAVASSESATAAAGSAAQAEEYKNDASEYALNKFTFYKTPSDPDGTIAGLAATTNGQSFRVAEGPEATAAFKTYENQDGVAVLQASQPGTAAVTGTIREFPTLAAAQADADAGNIPTGSTAYYRSADDATLAIEVINTSGTLQPTGRTAPSQEAIDLARSQIMSFLNSIFRTSGLPSGWDVLLGINKLGQYVGGIDSTGALNFGKIISAASEITTANVQNLNAGIISTTGGAKISGVTPDGFDYAIFNQLMQVCAGIKTDGSLAAGKIQAFYADIRRLVSDVIFNGGAKTTARLPEGFIWGPTDDYGRISFGLKENGNVAAGTIEVNKLIASSIDSPSLGEVKKPLAKRLTDVNHIIGFGQSLMAGINSMPLQTVSAILNAYRFNGGVRAQDGSGTSAENHASLLPYIETTHDTGDGVGYETPVGGAITAIFDRLSAEAEGYASGDIKILGSVPAQGSKTIAQLRQNPGPYMQRIIDDMTYGKARANELGLTYSPHAMIYMGNESDQSAGTTEEVYLDSFDKMIAAVNGFASDVTGNTESLPWFIYQFNSWKNRTPNTSYPTIPLALLKLARTRDDVRLVQPMYMYDYYDTAHLLGFDSKICGYRFGLAIEQEMLSGKKFEPLWSQDISLQGGIANIWYEPVGKLVLDTSIVTDPGNYGVSAIDPDGNALTITEVSVHLDRLRVRSSGGIPAGSKIRLGFTGGTTGTLPSRTNGPRCCLRDSQGDTIKFDPTGVAYRMDNYAIVEEITLN